MSIRDLLIVRVTHTPTGEAVRLPATPWRRTAKAIHSQCLDILRSRLAAERTGAGRSAREVAVYELPDGVDAPHDLLQFRHAIGPKGGLTS